MGSSLPFRTQLLIAFAAGVVCLALTASLITAWLSSKEVRALLVAQGLQITRSFAAQSVLALLYGSGDNARDSASATLSFPDVRHVGIFDRQQVPLLLEGRADGVRLPQGVTWTPGQALLVHETPDSYYFVAPVFTHDEQADRTSPFLPEKPTPELLGYVQVAISKSTLGTIQYTISGNNIVVTLLLALVLLVLLGLFVQRVIRPLNDLSEVMRRAEQGESQVRAAAGGPEEIAHIALVFNKMMVVLEERDRWLRQQNDLLESEVNVRTQELVEARDAALTASRHKSEFLANMSHELRTPMNAIIGYTEMVVEDLEIEGRDELVSDLRRVLAAAHQLLTLINNILDLAKIEAGRMDLHLELVRLQDIIDQAVDTVRPMMLKNHNRLEVRIEADDDAFEIDAGKLSQILLNLLSNAAKFTQNGRVTLFAKRLPDGLSVEIADTGIGMSREQQAHIFEEFRQLDMSPTRSYEGTGLGLAITRRFCDLMGGSIAVDSESGRGSTFRVRMPLPIHGSAALLGVEQSAREPRGGQRNALVPGDRPAVLAVDDDPAFLDILQRTLEQAGYRVYTAADAEQALIRARAVRPIAITLDIRLPDTDGWQVLDAFKRDPVLHDTPVLIISVLDERLQGLDRGAADYLTKPIERARLLAALNGIRDGLRPEDTKAQASVR